MTWQELVPYLVLIVPSAGLALLAGAFRWRYLRTIRFRLHPGSAATSPLPSPRPPLPSPLPPLEIGDAEAAPPLRAPAASARALAGHRTRAMRGAFVTALAVHFVTGAFVVSAGMATRDTPIAVGLVVGYAVAAPVLMLIPSYVRARWPG